MPRLPQTLAAPDEPVFIAVGNRPPFITSAARSAALRAVGIDEVVLHAEAAGWAESSRMASGCLALTAVS